MSDESASSSGGGGVRLQPRQVPVNSLKDVRPVLQQTLMQLDQPFIIKLEEMTGMDRERLFYIVCSAVMLFLLFGPGNAFLCTLIGVAYPAYQSMLAVRNPTKTDGTQWLVYWFLFGLFTLLDCVRWCSFALFTLLDCVRWCSFALFTLLNLVYRCSFALVTLLDYFFTSLGYVLPLYMTYGAHNVYVKFVQPLATWVEKRICKSKTK
uniref:Receptor expression-enhancing protein n=1 Tax=Globodera rostochiensis TaxID=31243 RepID=A0A914I683_GLORO